MRSRPRRTEPRPGQESVWDYPRPPRIDEPSELVVVTFAGIEIARTTRPARVLETSHPPTYYLPRDDVDWRHLRPASGGTRCEWKGQAAYFDLVVGDRVSPQAAWTYEDPTPAFATLAGHLAFYPQRVDEATVDGETVCAAQGDFYGGWVTSRIVGPFKGEVAGSMFW